MSVAGWETSWLGTVHCTMGKRRWKTALLTQFHGRKSTNYSHMLDSSRGVISLMYEKLQWKSRVNKYRIKMLTTNLYRIKIKWRMNHRRCSLARVKIIPRANCANSEICICRQAFHKWISLQFSCLRSFSVSSSRLNFPDGNIFVSLTGGKHKSFFLLLIFIDVKELAT